MSNKLIKDKFFIILFFFPLSFIFGIAVTEILVAICLIYFLLNYNKIEIFFKKKIIILVIFSVYISLNAFFQISDNLKYSSFIYFRYILFSLGIFIFYEKVINLNFNNKLFNIILFSFFILFFDSFLQFYTGKNILGYGIHAQRISSFFGDELILGSFLIRTLPILIWYIYHFQIKLFEKKFFYTVFFAAYFCVIYLSGERTSIGLFLIFFASIIFFIPDFKKIFIHSFIILLIFISSTIFFNFGKSSIDVRVFKKTYNQIFQVEQKNDIQTEQRNDTKDDKAVVSKKISKIYIFSKDHHGHLVLAKKIFLENPIFGAGPKGFRHYCRKVNYDPEIGICSTHPHNLLAQFASELGIIGLTFFLIFFIYIFKKFIQVNSIKNKSSHHYAILVISLGLLINLFPFLPSGNFFNNWISLFIYFNLGLYLVSYNKIISK